MSLGGRALSGIRASLILGHKALGILRPWVQGTLLATPEQPCAPSLCQIEDCPFIHCSQLAVAHHDLAVDDGRLYVPSSCAVDEAIRDVMNGHQVRFAQVDDG